MWDRKTEPYKSQGKVWSIPIRDIRVGTEPLRRDTGYEKLVELSQSLCENGMIHPLTVTMEQGVPVLVAGWRRLRAAKIAGWREVPCLIVPADRLHAAGYGLIENLQREDLHYLDVAAGIRSLIRRFQLTQAEVAGLLGCTQPAVANKLRLLKLSPRHQQVLREHGLSERHARALLRVEDETKREMLLAQMVKEGWSIEHTEQAVAPKPVKQNRTPIPMVKDLRLFYNTMNRAVEVMRRNGIDARIRQVEEAEYTELTVRIPKMVAEKTS